MMRFTFILLIALSASVRGAEVIDLGSLRVEGAARGPEANVTDTTQLGDDVASRFVQYQLKRLEQDLLRSDGAPGTTPQPQEVTR